MAPDEMRALRRLRGAWFGEGRSQGSGMTVPPGPVIPVPLLPSRRTDAGIRRRPARCFPFRSVNARWPRATGQRDDSSRFGRCTFGPWTAPTLARRIYAAAHLTGTFTLRSGVVSHEYFDKYRFESDPQLLADIAAGCAALVPDGIDALAGLELGGVPLATMISQVTRLPAVFVRKEAKTYGTCQLAEGARGRRAAPLHRRGRRHLGRRDPRRGARSCGPGARSSARSSA